MRPRKDPKIELAAGQFLPGSQLLMCRSVIVGTRKNRDRASDSLTNRFAAVLDCGEIGAQRRQQPSQYIRVVHDLSRHGAVSFCKFPQKLRVREMCDPRLSRRNVGWRARRHDQVPRQLSGILYQLACGLERNETTHTMPEEYGGNFGSIDEFLTYAACHR
jgi:hypothetical protein